MMNHCRILTHGNGKGVGVSRLRIIMPDFSLLPCPLSRFLVNRHMLQKLSFCSFEGCLGQGLSFSYGYTGNLAHWQSGPKMRPQRCYCNINNSNNALPSLGPYSTFSRHEFSLQTSPGGCCYCHIVHLSYTTYFSI